MRTLGNTTTAATGGPPSHNYAMTSTTAGVADGTTTILGPGLGGAAGWLQWFPNTNSAATPVGTSPSTIAKQGWLLSTAGALVVPLSAIASGTWTITVVLPAVAWTGSGQVGFRAFQVAADLSSSTAITLPGADARGWVVSANTGLSALATTTVTITLSSVGAVTVSAATPFFYVEFAFDELGAGVLQANIGIGSFTVDVPALSYIIAPAETLGAGSDSITRAFAGSRAPSLSTPAGADTITRTYSANRTPADSTPAGTDSVSRATSDQRIPSESIPNGSDTPTRTFAGARSPSLSTPAGSDSVTRTFGATRSPADTTPATVDTVTRVFSANRAPTDSTPAGSDVVVRKVGFGRVPTDTTPAGTDTPSRIFSAVRFPHEYLSGGTPDWPLNAPTKTLAGVTRDIGGAVLGSCTVKLFRQVDDLMVATMTSDSVTGAYSFTRGGDDPYNYYVLAYAPGSPQKHGLTDRGLVPV